MASEPVTTDARMAMEPGEVRLLSVYWRVLTAPRPARSAATTTTMCVAAS